MEEERQEVAESPQGSETDVRGLIQETISEYLNVERAKAEPAHQAELTEERKRREQLERRVNELVAENERSRSKAEETERNAAIRDELRRLGVSKVDLGFRAVKDDIYRTAEGTLAARSEGGDVSLREYLAEFARQNPELLPARIPGGSGASGRPGGSLAGDGGINLDSIKPGMDPEQLNRIRQEVAQAISHTLRKD